MSFLDQERWDYVRRHAERSYQDYGTDIDTCSHTYEYGIEDEENTPEEASEFVKWVDEQIHLERNPPKIVEAIVGGGYVQTNSGARPALDLYATEVFGLPYWLE